jgi:hypothetical protein
MRRIGCFLLAIVPFTVAVSCSDDVNQSQPALPRETSLANVVDPLFCHAYAKLAQTVDAFLLTPRETIRPCSAK